MKEPRLVIGLDTVINSVAEFTPRCHLCCVSWQTGTDKKQRTFFFSAYDLNSFQNQLRCYIIISRDNIRPIKEHYSYNTLLIDSSLSI